MQLYMYVVLHLYMLLGNKYTGDKTTDVLNYSSRELVLNRNVRISTQKSRVRRLLLSLFPLANDRRKQSGVRNLL